MAINDNKDSPLRVRAVKEMLEPLVGLAGFRWGDYTSCRSGVLDTLENDGLLAVPNPRKYRKAKDRQICVMEAILRTIHETPETDGKGGHIKHVAVIPYDSGIVPDINLARVLKKSPLLAVRFGKGQALIDALRQRMKQVSIEDLVVGYDWQSPVGNEKKFIVTTLVDCMKGYLLDGMIDDKAVKIGPYSDPQITAGRPGMMTVGNIPSLNDEQAYNVRIEGIVFYDEDGRMGSPESTYQLTTNHECGKNVFYPIKYGRQSYLFGDKRFPVERSGKEKLECYHSVLAVKKAGRFIKRTYGREMHDPFIEPSNRETAEMFRATRNIMVCEGKNGLFYPMNEAISEILMWKYLGYRNHLRQQNPRSRN